MARKKPKKKDEPDVIICAGADSPMRVHGASFDRRCGYCRRRVMLAPSGQEFLKKHPGTQVMCMYCFEDKKGDMKVDEMKFSADPKTIAEELSTIEANSWSEPN